MTTLSIADEDMRSQTPRGHGQLYRGPGHSSKRPGHPNRRLDQSTRRPGQPTKVPGSDHLVVQTEFPYVFWRASSRPYTPKPPYPEYLESKNYPYFYGDGKDDSISDPTTWKIMPIQIPDDLVSDTSQWTPMTTMEMTKYLIPPTPQYGRHPGVTESPHLFHPERLYTHVKNESHYLPSVSRYTDHRLPNKEAADEKDSYTFYQPEYLRSPQQVNQTEKPELSLSWHQSLMKQLEPFIDSHLPKLPSLPRFPSINGNNIIDRVPRWPLNEKRDTHTQPTITQGEPNTVQLGKQVVHKFYPILSYTHPDYQETITWKKTNRPIDFHPFHSEQLHLNGQSSDQNNQNFPAEHLFLSVNSNSNTGLQYAQLSDNRNYYNGNSPSPGQFHNRNEHLSANRAGYESYSHGVYRSGDNVASGHSNSSSGDKHLSQGDQFPNSYQLPQEHESHSTSSHFEIIQEKHSPDQNHPLTYHHRPVGDQNKPDRGQHHIINSKDNEHSEPNWPSNDSSYSLEEMNQSIQSSHNMYYKRPTQPLRQSASQANRPESQQGYNRPESQQGFSNSFVNPQPQDYSSPADDWKDQQPRPLLSQLFPDSAIVDRLANIDPLSPASVISGGMLVLALALALFYFNYVWYPTPVVTAKMIKLLLDAAPSELITADQEKAITEVYEVFRSLETTYSHNQDLWLPFCKNRMVCQVHKEVPGLWQVTQAYAALVRSSLATGPENSDDLDAYLKAAQQGEAATSCDTHYPACTMPPVPVRASLQRLLGIVQDNYPEVVYS
nr:uncharacterized protein LOC128689655 [Cherax quadricarinatus]